MVAWINLKKEKVVSLGNLVGYLFVQSVKVFLSSRTLRMVISCSVLNRFFLRVDQQFPRLGTIFSFFFEKRFIILNQIYKNDHARTRNRP